MSIDVVVILLMAIGFVVFVGEPFVRRTAAYWLTHDEQPEVEILSLQKETLYTAIRDLDFDFQTGKMDKTDYTELRGRLEGEALQVLRSLDDVDPLAALDKDLERQILDLRRQPRATDDVCRGCGAALEGGEKFCPSCGQSLISS